MPIIPQTLFSRRYRIKMTEGFPYGFIEIIMGIIIMDKSKKATAAVLATVILVSSAITGCSGKKDPEGSISKEDPWFSVSQAVIGAQYNNRDDIEWANTQFAGTSDGNIVYYVNGAMKPPKDAKAFEIDYDALFISNIDVYGEDCSLKRSIDLRKSFTDSKVFDIKDPEDGSIYQGNWTIQEDFKVEDGKVTMPVNAYLPSEDGFTPNIKTVNITIDLESGEVVSHSQKSANIPPVQQTYPVEQFYEFEGYYIRAYSVDTASGFTYVFVITRPDGSEVTLDFRTLFKDVDLSFLRGFVYCGNGKALIIGSPNASSDILSFDVDMEKGTATECVKNIDWLIPYLQNMTYIAGVGNVTVCESNISKLDLEQEKAVELFSFDSCNINRVESKYMSLLTMTEDKIILATDYFLTSKHYGFYSPATQKLFVLTREKTNPNAGKKVLNAAIIDGSDYTICEAVRKYNDTNPDYFIKFDYRYSVTSEGNGEGISIFDDDFAEKMEKRKAELLYQLMVDVSSGDGPDLLLNGTDCSNLNKDEYLIDLIPELETSGLFGNIIDASEKDGKLYQVPLGFEVKGVFTGRANVRADQKGFTFDEYKEFVKTTCNGEDKLGKSKLFFTTICLSGITDRFINNNKVDFNDPDFRAVAEYASENVFDIMQDGDSYDMLPIEAKSLTAEVEYGISFPMAMYRYSDSICDMRVLGLPSREERGPEIVVRTSIGVSAQTKEKDACIAFVKTLLSEDIQESLADCEGYTPVRIEAYEKTAAASVEDYNRTYNRIKDEIPQSERLLYGYPWSTVDPSAVDAFENIILSCTSVSSMDTAVGIILEEELPAYFSGQKNLDQVIMIINDRTQTYVDERG